QRVAYFNMGHFAECLHLRGVAQDALFNGAPDGRVLVAGVAAGDRDGGCHALEVPLEGAADGFVEVVDVEDQASVGRGIGANVADVRVSAELADDAGVGQSGQVGGHDRDGAA